MSEESAVEKLPAYRWLVDQWECYDCLTLPAVIHGYLCGIFSGKPRGAQAKEQLIREIALDEGLSSESAQTIVMQLAEMTEKQLADDGFAFQLCLPSDEEALSCRVLALSSWCQAFLTGLGITGVRQDDVDNRDIQSALGDIYQLTQVDAEGAMSDEDSEKNFTELVEYLRVSTLLIHLEFFKGLSNISGSEALH